METRKERKDLAQLEEKNKGDEMKNSDFNLDSVQDQKWEGNMTLNHPSALLILVQNETVPSLPRHNSYTPG